MKTEVDIAEKVILTKINKRYRDSMTPEALYEATRGVWKIGPRRDEADYAFSVFQGEVKEVYRIRSWLPAGTLKYITRATSDVEIEGRWELEGELAEKEVRNNYVETSVRGYFLQGASNPVMYVNC